MMKLINAQINCDDPMMARLLPAEEFDVGEGWGWDWGAAWASQLSLPAIM